MRYPAIPEISGATCRAPGYVLDDEERRMVDRFLAEFADWLPRFD